VNEARPAAKRPLVALVCRVPILCEALTGALEDVLTVQSFQPSGDTGGLLRSLRPDGVVVDSDEEAAQTEEYARESGAPVVLIALEARVLRVLRDGRWEEPADATASSEGVRNVLVGGIFGKGRHK
jgi:hypothetical protein